MKLKILPVLIDLLLLPLAIRSHRFGKICSSFSFSSIPHLLLVFISCLFLFLSFFLSINPFRPQGPLPSWCREQGNF